MDCWQGAWKPHLDRIVLFHPGLHHEPGKAQSVKRTGFAKQSTSPAIATIMSSANATAALQAVLERIAASAHTAGRDAANIELIAVSKTRSADEIKAMAHQGVRSFGENYLQEALPKIETLRDLPICWHFIGHIQGNKTREIAAGFDWVHTVDRVRIAERLCQHTPTHRTLNVLIQVNVDSDPAKGGVGIDDRAGLQRIMAAIRKCPRLRLRGLMTILAVETLPLEGYSRLKGLFEESRDAGGPHWDTLSMGMSADFDLAIASGATQVRVGAAIFGPRTANH
jgi:pyridoxal phosphate enzyme (YggS family)